MANELLKPDDFMNEKIIHEIPDSGAYTVASIKPDTVIYRGDHRGTKIPTGNVPVFFADKQSATIYTRKDETKMYSYKIIKTPRLFVLSFPSILELAEDERLNAEERAALEAYLNISEDGVPYMIPVGFLNKENAAGEHPLYLNRRIVNIICRLGYDGWVVFPDSLIQRNMDTKYYMETQKVRYVLNPYNPEIVICKWDEFVVPLK
jgi:hypothetical protein